MDCTGGQQLLWGGNTNNDWDKIAYVATGREYGLINLDVANGVTYDIYEQYKSDYQNYEAAVDDYNELYDEYTSLYWHCIFAIEIDTECYQLDSMYDELIRQEAELDRQSAELGPVWKTLGIVENINIYW